MVTAQSGALRIKAERTRREVSNILKTQNETVTNLFEIAFLCSNSAFKIAHQAANPEWYYGPYKRSLCEKITFPYSDQYVNSFLCLDRHADVVEGSFAVHTSDKVLGRSW